MKKAIASKGRLRRKTTVGQEVITSLKEAIAWAGGETPGGRFCNVFHFRDGKIDRIYVYLDPDYGGEDRDRFLWGSDRRW